MTFPTRSPFPTSADPSSVSPPASSPGGAPPAAGAADEGGLPAPDRAGRPRPTGYSPACVPPDPEAPGLLGVPPFEPLKVRSSALRLQRALRRQRRAMAAGLAVTAAALAASTAHGADDTGADTI